jgi:hypothetical protein
LNEAFEISLPQFKSKVSCGMKTIILESGETLESHAKSGQFQSVADHGVVGG